MAKKPAGLIYGVDDKPPLTTSALLGIQHVFVMTAGWVMVVVIVSTIRLSRFLFDFLHLRCPRRCRQSSLIAIRQSLALPRNCYGSSQRPTLGE